MNLPSVDVIHLPHKDMYINQFHQLKGIKMHQRIWEIGILFDFKEWFYLKESVIEIGFNLLRIQPGEQMVHLAYCIFYKQRYNLQSRSN